jgi:hypothetical protein
MTYDERKIHKMERIRNRMDNDKNYKVLIVPRMSFTRFDPVHPAAFIFSIL